MGLGLAGLAGPVGIRIIGVDDLRGVGVVGVRGVVTFTIGNKGFLVERRGVGHRDRLPGLAVEEVLGVIDAVVGLSAEVDAKLGSVISLSSVVEV